MVGNKDIKYIKGVGERRAQLFAQLGVYDLDALLHFYPRTYIDLTQCRKICEAPFGMPCAVKVFLCTPVKEYYIRKNLVLYKFFVSDGQDRMQVTIFNSKYLAASLTVGKEYIFYGRIDGNLVRREMSSPEVFDASLCGLLPVYPTTRGLTSATISKIISNALQISEIQDHLPEYLKEKYLLCSLKSALCMIHAPKSRDELDQARRRLVFDELFLFQLALKKRSRESMKTTDITIKRDCSSEFEQRLPFTLTDGQKSSIKDCVDDILCGKRLNRLIQGDVGSGKTAVAASVTYTMLENGYQVAVMTPTEILAEQHFATFGKFLADTGCTVALISGSVKKSDKDRIKKALACGEIDLLIGTHAMIEQDVVFNNLGLVITDEQHRFGVSQRAALSDKSKSVHTLVLSATPIPRTLGLILYGDLDISVIKALPRGRQKTDTFVVTSSYHDRIYEFIKKQTAEGRQAYIVCPLVEENEEIDLISAEEYYNTLKNGAFKGLSVGLLHGKMKPRDKDAVMRDFVDGKTDILVATTVIEIGIDVPNATVMVIENAERFGLAQLHQLRGRIGRGEYKSTCILISDSNSEETKKRLEVIRTSCDGFKISDEDMKLRGPGDFLGTRQHGLPLFKLANICADMDMLKATAKEAEDLLCADCELSRYPLLAQNCRAACESSLNA